MAFNITIMLQFSLLFLIMMIGRNGARSISSEDLMDKSLKTIETKFGQVFDCVDINEQPALNHPLLKNHTVQMKPTSFPTGFKRKASNTSTFTHEVWTKDVECPEGSIPILRVEKDAPEMAQHLQKYIGMHPPRDNHHFVAAVTRGMFHGSRTYMSTHNPQVLHDQFSSGAMWIQNGPLDELNSIQVGWTVNPTLYGDNRTHLFGYWTADGFKNTGCFDARCPGFIQVSPSSPLGLIFELPHSGKIIALSEYHVFQDSKTGDWWLAIFPHELMIGYWPSSLFTSLSSHAEEIGWGGETYSPQNEPAPPMGNGNYVEHDIFKTCYAGYIEIIDESYKYKDLRGMPVDDDWQSASCYALQYEGCKTDVGCAVLFGGAGGDSC